MLVIGVWFADDIAKFGMVVSIFSHKPPLSRMRHGSAVCTEYSTDNAMQPCSKTKEHGSSKSKIIAIIFRG